jgi:hypothetical protein
MKKIHSTMIVVFILTFLFVAPAAAQVDGIVPQAVVEYFYDKYLQLKIRGLPDKDQAYDLSRYFTAQIYNLFKVDLKKQAEFIKKHPDEKPPWIEGDIFTSLFEGATSFRMGKIRVRGAAREVDVKFEYSKGAEKSKWTDTVILQKVGKRWRISNIIFKGKWQFKSGSSLLDVLR